MFMQDRLDLGIHWPTGLIDETLRNTSQTRLNTLVDIFVTGGCNAIPVDDIEAARWQKNLWFAREPLVAHK